VADRPTPTQSAKILSVAHSHRETHQTTLDALDDLRGSSRNPLDAANDLDTKQIFKPTQLRFSNGVDTLLTMSATFECHSHFNRTVAGSDPTTFPAQDIRSAAFRARTFTRRTLSFSQEGWSVEVW
jgi:hypothetical protein